MNALKDSIYRIEDLEKEAKNIYALAGILLLAIENQHCQIDNEQYFLAINMIFDLSNDLKNNLAKEVNLALEIMRDTK